MLTMKTKPAGDTLSYLRAVRRMIVNAGKRVRMADMDELTQLLAMRSDIEQAITTAIQGLHYEAGYTWQTIADTTGTTRQAVLMRYAVKPQ